MIIGRQTSHDSMTLDYWPYNHASPIDLRCVICNSEEKHIFKHISLKSATFFEPMDSCCIGFRCLKPIFDVLDLSSEIKDSTE